jgi:hypothetical protein
MTGRPTIQIRQTGHTYGIFLDGKLVEGGFFSKESAVAASIIIAKEMK